MTSVRQSFTTAFDTHRRSDDLGDAAQIEGLGDDRAGASRRKLP
jgi:hypothetical protein